jgi:DNA-binding transcriptional MerR regulator
LDQIAPTILSLLGTQGSVPLDKAPDAFRTISEVADELDVPQHVLRFWETRFAQIKPMKRSGGRRYYRRDDVELLRGIRHLLYGQGYTIRGVQRILREQGIKAVQGFSGGGFSGGGFSSGVALQQATSAEDAEAPDLEMLDDDVGTDEAGQDDVLAVVPIRPDAAPIVRPPATPSIVSANSVEQVVAAGPPPAPVVIRRLGDENANRLRGALDDLLECRRLLDGALLTS